MDSNFGIANIISSFKIGDTVYRVSDVDNIKRHLSFKKPNMPCFYLHSAVYLDTTRRHQPVYRIPQMVFDYYSKSYNFVSSLVLGCAGCTIPRYLALSFPNCHIDGIEHSKKMIDIAKQYFFIEQFNNHFDLIMDDAFNYLNKATNKSYDLVYIDLFDDCYIPLEKYDNCFFSKLFGLSSNKCVIVINLLEVNSLKCDYLMNIARYFFLNSIVVHQDTHSFLILTNGFDTKYLLDFILKNELDFD